MFDPDANRPYSTHGTGPLIPGNGGKLGLQTDNARTRTETERAMEFLADAIDRTHKLVEMLSVKLSPVVAPAPESAKSGTAADEGFASPLATLIADKAGDISAVNRRLAELHSSIQL